MAKKTFDEDKQLKQQAGIEDLTGFDIESEAQRVCYSYNISMNEYFEMEDVYVTRLLIYQNLYSNFEKKFSDLKSKQKKR